MSKKCNECGSKREPYAVPYTIFEDFKETSIKTIKMLFSTIIILVILLVGTNAAWLWYESQFENVAETEKIVVESEKDGVANYIGRDGSIYNGENICNTND